jgi:cell division septation protein DedD
MRAVPFFLSLALLLIFVVPAASRPAAAPAAAAVDWQSAADRAPAVLQTPTATPTVYAPICPGPVIFSGALAAGDPYQAGRLAIDGVPDTCAAGGTCSIQTGGSRLYDAYYFNNNTGSSQCVTVQATALPCTGNNAVLLTTYLGSFNPGNICTNWVADSGVGTDPYANYSFNIPASQNFVVVVSEINAGRGCDAYTINVTAGACVATPTNTPTPSRTPTATNTAQPPTATNTAQPPTATNTAQPPTATDTPEPPTSTATTAPSATATVPPVYRIYLPAIFLNAITP